MSKNPVIETSFRMFSKIFFVEKLKSKDSIIQTSEIKFYEIESLLRT